MYNGRAAERSAFGQLLRKMPAMRKTDLGLSDALYDYVLDMSLREADVMRRHVPPEQTLFIWWSYRNRDWRASNRGRRLDHIWTTPALGGSAVSMTVADETRDWPRPSDHVPVIADFEIE